MTGGGLTVIANAPNPAGQALLARYFDGAVSPLCLCAGALLPTLVAAAAFVCCRSRGAYLSARSTVAAAGFDCSVRRLSI